MGSLADDGTDDKITIIDVPTVTDLPITLMLPKILLTLMNPCCGIELVFSPGQNKHISYPFGLHND